MKFELIILGNTSPFPSKGRLPTCQLLNINERWYMIDCGEGAQIRMNEYRIKRSKIDYIFISHLHGDHYYGLLGLLGSYRVNRRETPLHIYCPKGLDELIALEARISYAGDFKFPLHYHFTDHTKSELLLQNEDIEVYSIPLSHWEIPTTGFLFRERQQPRKMMKDKIKLYDIPYQQIPNIKAGADFTTTGNDIIPNRELTFDPPKPKSYAFCSDTVYKEDIVPIISEVDLLYHEATFSYADAPNASRKGHSNTIDAATIAKKANVGKLIIGHFSTRYHQLEPLAQEARTVFENTEVAEEGKVFSLSSDLTD
jgi:ribonuclease Z